MSVKAYHMTTKNNWESIQSHGAIQKGSSLDMEIGVLGVFLCSDKTDSLEVWAKWVAHSHLVRWSQNDKLACLEIEIPENQLKKLHPDPVTNNMRFDGDEYVEGYGDDWYFENEIPVDWVKAVHWVKRYYSHCNTGQSIKPSEVPTGSKVESGLWVQQFKFIEGRK